MQVLYLLLNRSYTSRATPYLRTTQPDMTGVSRHVAYHVLQQIHSMERLTNTWYYVTSSRLDR